MSSGKTPLATRNRLRAARGFVIDMDGTLVLGDKNNKGLKPLPGALNFLRWLKQRDLPYVLFTNGTTRTPAAYGAMMRELGFPVSDEQMMTPVSSAISTFQRAGHRRVMVLGGDGLCTPMREAGIEVVEPQGKQQVDAVMVGWFREFGMSHLEAACEAVWGGARFYSASQVQFFASAAGRAMGTSRAISAMVSDMTGCRVQVVGKPSIQALGCAARRMKQKLSDLVVIGDDPDLEVAMAHRGRALAVAVHTGLSGAEIFNGLPRERRPHVQVRGVDQFHSILKEVL